VAKTVNLKIESDENGIKIDAEGTDGDGNPTHVQYDANSTERITRLPACRTPTRFR
jgi:hypothetical protein